MILKNYCVLCIVHCVLCIVYYVLCIVYCASCIMYYVLCIVYCASCIMYYVLCIVYYVLCIVHCVLCITKTHLFLHHRIMWIPHVHLNWLFGLVTRVELETDIIQTHREQRHAGQVTNVVQSREGDHFLHHRRLQQCYIHLQRITNINNITHGL